MDFPILNRRYNEDAALFFLVGKIASHRTTHKKVIEKFQSQIELHKTMELLRQLLPLHRLGSIPQNEINKLYAINSLGMGEWERDRFHQAMFKRKLTNHERTFAHNHHQPQQHTQFLEKS